MVPLSPPAVGRRRGGGSRKRRRPRRLLLAAAAAAMMMGRMGVATTVAAFLGPSTTRIALAPDADVAFCHHRSYGGGSGTCGGRRRRSSGGGRRQLELTGTSRDDAFVRGNELFWGDSLPYERRGSQMQTYAAGSPLARARSGRERMATSSPPSSLLLEYLVAIPVGDNDELVNELEHVQRGMVSECPVLIHTCVPTDAMRLPLLRVAVRAPIPAYDEDAAASAAAAVRQELLDVVEAVVERVVYLFEDDEEEEERTEEAVRRRHSFRADGVIEPLLLDVGALEVDGADNDVLLTVASETSGRGRGMARLRELVRELWIEIERKDGWTASLPPDPHNETPSHEDKRHGTGGAAAAPPFRPRIPFMRLPADWDDILSYNLGMRDRSAARLQAASDQGGNGLSPVLWGQWMGNRFSTNVRMKEVAIYERDPEATRSGVAAAAASAMEAASALAAAAEGAAATNYREESGGRPVQREFQVHWGQWMDDAFGTDVMRDVTIDERASEERTTDRRDRTEAPVVEEERSDSSSTDYDESEANLGPDATAFQKRWGKWMDDAFGTDVGKRQVAIYERTGEREKKKSIHDGATAAEKTVTIMPTMMDRGGSDGDSSDGDSSDGDSSDGDLDDKSSPSFPVDEAAFRLPYASIALPAGHDQAARSGTERLWEQQRHNDHQMQQQQQLQRVGGW